MEYNLENFKKFALEKNKYLDFAKTSFKIEEGKLYSKFEHEKLWHSEEGYNIGNLFEEWKAEVDAAEEQKKKKHD